MTQHLRLPPSYQALVSTVARFGQLTTSQLRRLHYTTGTPRGRVVRCQVALKRLVKLGVLTHAERPRGGYQGGSGVYIFQLARRGKRPRPNWHQLDCAEIYVRLTEAFGDVQFVPEPWCHFKVDGVNIQPDGAFEVNGAKYLLEMDLGSEFPSRLDEKMRRYVRAYDKWDVDKHGPVIPLVLWVCHDEARKRQIEIVVSRQRVKQLFETVLFDNVCATVGV